jgi:regulatory protein
MHISKPKCFRMQNMLTISDIRKKMEHFCAYQDRCHEEVISKMRAMAVSRDEIDEIVVYLIGENFLNEERFAKSFARGKHRIKHWGKVRIINELKGRNISQYNINSALKEIAPEEYAESFHTLSQRHWESITERNALKKRKKFCDFLLRKGYESDLVYARAKELEKDQ